MVLINFLSQNPANFERYSYLLEISSSGILHDDVKSSFFDEMGITSHNVRVFKLPQYLRFLHYILYLGLL
jgi:hypothetical protein